jgi:enterochelin esterase-like enzyme
VQGTPVAADPLERGKPIARPLKSTEVHRYRIELPAASVATGVVMQDGIDLAVVTYDATGKKVAEFDSPNGSKGPEPFVIEGTVAGAYDFEIKPFVEPARGSGAAPVETGRYEAKLEEIITAEVYVERKAARRISSPRIRELWRAIRAKQADAVAKFWTDLKGKSPIVEPYPGDPKDVLVTFVLRATTPYVGMFGGRGWREKPLVRIGDSDLWYLTMRVPADSRFDYAFITADGPPEYHVPYQKDPTPDPRFTTKLLDPNNSTEQHFGFSRIELPAAPPQPWIVAKPDVAKGKVAELKLESTGLKETRRIGIYTPAGYDPKRTYPLLIVFDGEIYGLDANPLIPLPTVLDNLIAAKKIPPLVAALVANQGIRDRDLAGSPPFAAFVAKELVPKLRADYRAGMTPGDTIVTGSSLGGLSSTFVALHHPDVIGNVLSQSGAYQFKPGSFTTDLSESVEGGWLMREVAKTPKQPIRFYLDAGHFEDDLLASNRHMRDVLVAKGYPVTYAEFNGAHDYWMWRHTIADGLMALTRKP